MFSHALALDPHNLCKDDLSGPPSYYRLCNFLRKSAPLYSGPAPPTWSMANVSPSKPSEDGHSQMGLETTLFTDQYLTGDVADDSETDYVDESAIDDDDPSSDWEDSIEDSDKSSTEEVVFQRVDSKANLTTRRSLITLMIHEQNGRSSNLSNTACQCTSALPWPRTSLPAPPTLAVSLNDSDDAPLMMKCGARSSPLKPINEVPLSAAQSFITGARKNHRQVAFSPRTTRRNMIGTELTESLRYDILWERQEKSLTANAVLKRRHTSYDFVKDYPEKVCMEYTKDVPIDPSDFFANMFNIGGYNCHGW